MVLVRLRDVVRHDVETVLSVRFSGVLLALLGPLSSNHPAAPIKKELKTDEHTEEKVFSAVTLKRHEAPNGFETAVYK